MTSMLRTRRRPSIPSTCKSVDSDYRSKLVGKLLPPSYPLKWKCYLHPGGAAYGNSCWPRQRHACGKSLVVSVHCLSMQYPYTHTAEWDPMLCFGT